MKTYKTYRDYSCITYRIHTYSIDYYKEKTTHLTKSKSFKQNELQEATDSFNKIVNSINKNEGSYRGNQVDLVLLIATQSFQIFNTGERIRNHKIGDVINETSYKETVILSSSSDFIKGDK